MMTNTNNLAYGKYGMHIALVIVAAVVIIVGIWMWFDHKQSQIDARFYNASHQLTNLKSSPYETTDFPTDHSTPGRSMDAFYINYYRAQPGE